jgi:hypothetical protein
VKDEPKLLKPGKPIKDIDYRVRYDLAFLVIVYCGISHGSYNICIYKIPVSKYY